MRWPLARAAEKELEPVIKRLFVAAPPALTGLFVVGCVVTGADERFVFGSVAAAKLIGGVGLALAAVRYGRGEYLFWAWASLAANLVLLGVSELLFTARFDLLRLAAPARDAAWAITILIANVFAAAGTLMLARVWRVVGLALPDPSGAKRIGAIVGVIVATLLVGWVEIPAWQAMLAGRLSGAVGVVGAACDLICFGVITPLALRALSLRGGSLAWPWGLIAASFFAWMLFDFFVELALPLPEAWATALVNGLRIAACLLAMGAGLAQRWATRAAVARE
jgi:hypothetical protein